MSLRLTTSFINTSVPGAYANVVVQSQPVGVGASGIIILMGEADGGPSYSQSPLASNAYTVDQLAQVQAKYVSGQLVDAMGALTAPSADPGIVGSANLVYLLKTNTGTAASALLATS